MKNKEIERIKNIYDCYDNDINYLEKYASNNLRVQYIAKVLEYEILTILNNFFSNKLRDLKFLDIGCGNGNFELSLLKFGIHHNNIYGVDLSFHRLLKFNTSFPKITVINNNAMYLPFNNQVFDVVFQRVVFSSILDDNICYCISGEMLRVLKKNGIIIWYDSYGGKKMSKYTRSYIEKDINNFFPNCTYKFKKIIPHSQITFRLAKYSWLACDIISKLFPFFNCMQFAVIKNRNL